MPAISAILFDKDGTLLDYARSWLPVNRAVAMLAAQDNADLADHLLQACGMDPVSGHVVPDSLLAAGNTVEIADGLIAAGGTLGREMLIREMDIAFARGAEHSVPVTDLLAFFTRLKERGLKTGIASSDNEKSIRATAERFGFARLVDFVAGYDSGYGCKPEPGMALAFCQAVGVRPENTAMVGDNNHDMHMGRTAGCGLVIGVLTGTGSRGSLSTASDHVLDNITQIEALL
jgi:phosphoglycolate phosphatase